MGEYYKGYYKKNKERILEKNREWLDNPINKEKYGTWAKDYRKRNRVKLNTHSRDHKRRIKERVIQHYGGKCVCCGESNIKFLTIDHTDNNGKEMRSVHGIGSTFYLWIERNNYPTSLQVMCYNCNCGRAHNDNVCPHTEVNEQYPLEYALECST